MIELEKKENNLENLLQNLAPVVVAFSGGVDSSYLAYKAHQVLGNQALAILAESASVPENQKRMAERIVRQYGIPYKTIHSQEIELEEYSSNSSDRCFYCKNELFTKLQAIAHESGSWTVLDGLNADDLGDFRPGRKAANKNGVRSPLMEVGLSKKEIRELSRRAGLPTADMPASACLASRIPYGVRITEQVLRLVDRGEDALRELGFQIFRVRHHEHLVRLEFGTEDLIKALNPEKALQLAKLFKGFGYKYVTLDLEGYRTGSGNEVLSEDQKKAFET